VLHQALVDHLGEREADVLMDLLPATDVALKSDIEHLRLEMLVMEARLTAGFHRDLIRQTWILAGTLLAGLGALGGLLR